MTDTDRTKIKNQEEGEFVTAAGIVDAHAEVRQIHSRTRDFLKTGAENAATNVSESVLCSVFRKSRLRRISILTGTNVATDNTSYDVFSFFQRDAAGANQKLMGSWNTHGGGQKAITALVPAVIHSGVGLITNSDSIMTPTSDDTPFQITYQILKYGSGQAVAALSVFSLDLEEI